jgi:RNA polymerase sigma-70 factor (ECF subfamily)
LDAVGIGMRITFRRPPKSDFDSEQIDMSPTISTLQVALILTASLVCLVHRPGGAAMFARAAADRRLGRGDLLHRDRPATGLVRSEALATSPDPGSPHDPGSGLSVVAGPTVEERRIEALVDLAQAGDPDAFGELFEHFQGPIYRQLYFLTRSSHVAEDLTSETFFRALRAMRVSQMPGPYFAPWLRKIARNLANDHHTARVTKLERTTGDFSWFEAGGPDAGLAASEESDRIRDALSRLPESQRRVLAMRFLCQLSIEETAELVGCTYGAAKQLQWRGLRNLERIISEQEAV